MIRLENITRTYTNGEVSVHALRGINLEIKGGEFVAIMGASGSGKSTLMNILGCLDKPTSGSYFLDGKDVARLSRDDLAEVRKRKLGFVFQGFNLLPRTSALENVELPMLYMHVSAKERKARAAEVLKMVGLESRMDHLPNQLSGGQQQRVAIARALVNRPRVLLADEPTGNLDSTTSVEIMGLFQALNQEGITIAVVTHELDIARYTRRNLVFKDGMLQKDEPVTNRLVATEELKKMQAVPATTVHH